MGQYITAISYNRFESKPFDEFSGNNLRAFPLLIFSIDVKRTVYRPIIDLLREGSLTRRDHEVEDQTLTRTCRDSPR